MWNIVWVLPQGHRQGDHLSGKPGNVREVESCQGIVKDFTENPGIVREKIRGVMIDFFT